MNHDRNSRLLLFGLLPAVLLLSPSGAGCEELFYYLEDGRVVITNTPSRADVRVVPGFHEKVTLAMRGDMPSTPWDRSIDLLARRHGLQPELIKAVALVESGLDPQAVSPKGAVGLMQLMPETASMLGVDDPFDPEQNLSGGARYLRMLLDRFGGDLTLALAGYNAGPGAVERHRGVPAYSETRSYVRKVREKLDRNGAGSDRSTSVVEGESRDLSCRRLPDGTVLISN